MNTSKFAIAIIVLSLLVRTAYAGVQSEYGDLCLRDNVCLGMSLGEVGKLNIKQAGNLGSKVRIVNEKDASWPKVTPTHKGLGKTGKPVAIYVPGLMDKPAASFITAKMQIACAASKQVFSEIHSDDGGKILLFYGVSRAGEIVVHEIKRMLPNGILMSDIANYERQAREKFGKYYTSDYYGDGHKHLPSFVTMDKSMGYSLRMKVRQAMAEKERTEAMKRPGCSNQISSDF